MHRNVNRLAALFRVAEGNSDLTLAQHAAFSKQIPLLYITLLVNSWALAYTFLKIAPASLAVYAPAALTLACAARIISWCQAIGKPIDADGALKALRRTNRLSGILAFLFAAWGLSLYHYGDAYARGHVVFFMGITEIGCVFCLMHLRSAALRVILTVNTMFVGFFITSGNPVFVAISLNILLVSVVMTTVLWVYYSGFVDLIESRRALASLQVETAALSDQNFKVANVDSLTGLPNRRHFFAELKKCSRLATVPGAFNAVGVIDLDHFKAVNDGFGHAAGDSLLKVIALRLGQHSHADFVVARLGGDEFGLLIRNVKRESDLEAIGEQLCCDLIEPVVISEGTMFISASIGLSVISQGGSGSEAYESADYALYDAKRNGKARSVLFTPAHRDEIRKAVKVARAIEKPGFEKELMVAFQPIVDIYSGDVVAFEALARWHSEELGDVSPAVFIAAAERSGLIGRLTSALLAKALKAASTWPTGIRLSFNLSANDITSTEGMTRLISVISRSGFDPSRIDFEITETAALIDLDQAKSAIRTLKAWGVGISLDDFGTGYSSLTQVHQLAVDKIKIDRSFVVDITSNPLSYNIVKSVIALSRDMNIGCIVEGVETQEALECLKMLGCSLVQGYYIAKPMLSHDVTSYLDHVRQRPAAA